MSRKLSTSLIVMTLLLMMFVWCCEQAEKSALAAAVFGSAGSATEKEKAGTQSTAESILQGKYNLAAERSIKSRYYCMETKVVNLGEDGTRTVPVSLRLLLMCSPAGQSPQDGYRYTCAKVTIQKGNEPEVRIPALNGWSYLLKRTEDGGFHQGGLIFGIDHGKFQGLKDSKGNALPPEGAYVIYNMFVDFHAFCNQFAERAMTGNGIQNLKRIGKKIVHESAFSEPTIQLSGNIEEVTLEFKGLSIVDCVACAIVGFDSGDSSFKFLIKPAPDMEIKTVGASHYWGDLYIELDSRWVRKCAMGELTVSKVTLGNQKDVNSVMERSTTIRSIDKDEFEKLVDNK